MLKNWSKAGKAANAENESNAGNAGKTGKVANVANADFRDWFPRNVPILRIGHGDSVTCYKNGL